MCPSDHACLSASRGDFRHPNDGGVGVSSLVRRLRSLPVERRSFVRKLSLIQEFSCCPTHATKASRTPAFVLRSNTWLTAHRPRPSATSPTVICAFSTSRLALDLETFTIHSAFPTDSSKREGVAPHAHSRATMRAAIAADS
jgi:hypothetical protein